MEKLIYRLYTWFACVCIKISESILAGWLQTMTHKNMHSKTHPDFTGCQPDGIHLNGSWLLQFLIGMTNIFVSALKTLSRYTNCICNNRKAILGWINMLICQSLTIWACLTLYVHIWSNVHLNEVLITDSFSVFKLHNVLFLRLLTSSLPVVLINHNTVWGSSLNQHPWLNLIHHYVCVVPILVFVRTNWFLTKTTAASICFWQNCLLNKASNYPRVAKYVLYQAKCFFLIRVRLHFYLS